ncbi:hypothetical protein HDU96_004371, partial [Phlyctochytrium bullatum]
LLYCDPDGTPLVTSETWSACSTCKALKVAVPKLVMSALATPTKHMNTSIFGRLRAAVTHNETTRTAIVVFGGSDLFDGLSTNLGLWNMTNINGTAAQVNEGISIAYFSIELQANRLLRDALKQCSSCDTVAFTGHSMGGAVATLAAFQHATRGSLGGRRIRLYSFGSPSIGNDAFWEAFNRTGAVASYIRFVNGRDSIPLAPNVAPYSQSTGYAYWPSQNPNIVTCTGNDTALDAGCGRQISTTSVADHRFFGSFFQDNRICTSNYAPVLDAIPVHQEASTIPVPAASLAPAPPNGTDLQDPVFRTLLPYSVASAAVYCDPVRTIGSAELWRTAKTLTALKWAPFRLVRVAFNGSRIASNSPTYEERFADGELRNFTGLMAGVSYNVTTKTALVVFRGTVGYDNWLYTNLK